MISKSLITARKRSKSCSRRWQKPSTKCIGTIKKYLRSTTGMGKRYGNLAKAVR